ncbi:MAG: SDR family NAD(P)-dependent oxidoreductase [Lachnospiraceae bacterium]
MRIALITGASSGIGREFARQIPKLYKDLDAVWLVARRTDRLKQLESELDIPVQIFDGDLTRDYIYERIENELSRKRADIRMLVNCAGYGKAGIFRGSDEKSQLGMIDLNCRALTKMIHVCLPFFSGGSRIINLASAASFSPQPGFAVYAASKSYVKSLSYALGAELNERGIYVTCVCPGPVDTEFFERSGELPGKEKLLKKAPVEKVVHKALLDAARKRKSSVYGFSMQSVRIGTKILPSFVSTEFMRLFNNI